MAFPAEALLGELNCRIDTFLHTLEEDFAENGILECRFLDVDLLSMLFSHCSEDAARTFCHRLSGEYRVHFVGGVVQEGRLPAGPYRQGRAASRRAGH